jgi:hypothetical protein
MPRSPHTDVRVIKSLPLAVQAGSEFADTIELERLSIALRAQAAP